MAAMPTREETERDVAAGVAEFLRGQAAKLPVDSQLRSLCLQSAGTWANIAGHKKRRHLALVTLAGFTEGVA